MKKKRLKDYPELKRIIGKGLLIMRLSLILMVVGVLQSAASVYSQNWRMSMNEKSIMVKDVLTKIEHSSEFRFFYEEKKVNVEKKVDVEITNATIDDIMSMLFNSAGIEYKVLDSNFIILKPKGDSPSTSINSSQQKKSITGKVTDPSGATLPGVSVVVKGTTIGVITDMDGKFSLSNVSENATLQFSFIGMKTQEIDVAGKSIIDVVFEEESIGLEEVVAVGYGTQSARKVSGSISQVSSKDINKINTPTLDVALQGRSSGMQVSATSGEPGALSRIRIRGSNSFQGNNEPLIVLDGYPLVSDNAPTGGLDASSSSVLSFINMDDVASIEILKDASATAIYGARGANGVLMITTKKGKATEKPVINFSSEAFASESIDYPEMMSGPQYVEYGNSLPRWDPALPTDTTTTTWIDKVMQRSWGQNYNLSVAGGSVQNRYLVSGSYSDYAGIITGSGFERATLRTNLNNQLTEKITLSTNINYSVTENDRIAGSDGSKNTETGGGIIFNALRNSPLANEDQLMASEIDPVPTNPIYQLTGQTDKENIKLFLANINLDYQIYEDLKLTVQGGTNSTVQNRERYWNKNTSPGYLYNSQAWLLNQQTMDYLAELYASYSKSIDRHSINAVLGYSWQKNILKSHVNQVRNFFSDALEIYGLEYGTLINPYYYRREDRQLQSYFFRANYDYSSKYLISFSGRMDGSSVFTPNNKYSFFPSVSGAWRVNEEEFMKGIRAISEFKLRAGIGETGSQAIQPYQSIPQYGKANYVSGNGEVAGVRPTIMGNPELKWETTAQFNAGLDLKFLAGRIGFTFDYYKKTTRDLLMPFQLPGSAGYRTITMNRGKLGNEGFEITLEGEPVKTPDFTWRTNFNYSRNRSEVLDLGGLPYIAGPIMDSNFLNEPISGQFVGQPFSVFYGYELDGLIQPEDFDASGKPKFATYNGISEKGYWKFKDQNGDKIISATDRVILGDPNPDFMIGFNNDISYKNFTINVFIQGVYGNDLFNATDIYVGTGYKYYNNRASWYENRWTPDNPHNNIKYPAGSVQQYFKPTSATIEDGSYTRLKNVSLRYNVPLKNMKVVKSIELYVTGTNLLTITNYSGLDPEVSLFGKRDDAIGVDFFAYPQSRTFTFGFKMGL